MYNYNNILKCIEAVKALNTTASKKADHYPLYNEVKKMYEYCYEMTRCILFDVHDLKLICSDAMYDYTQTINYSFKNTTKKELDKMLRRSVNYLKNELIAIHRGIEAGDLPSDRSTIKQ